MLLQPDHDDDILFDDADADDRPQDSVAPAITDVVQERDVGAFVESPMHQPPSASTVKKPSLFKQRRKF